MLVGTPKQFRAYDAYVQSQLNETVQAMILRAAKTLYPYVAKEDHLVVLAGRGNNGADGLALACLLKNMEQDVTVFLMAERSQLSVGADFYLDKAMALSVPIFYLSEAEDFSKHKFHEKIQTAGVIIDAIFGTGLNRAPTGIEKMVIHDINEQQHVPILSIDVPSGMNAENGLIMGEAVHAHLTVTFVAMKSGFLNPDAAVCLGEIHVEELGYDPAVASHVGLARYLEPEVIEAMLRPRKYDGYKGTYGQLACLTGSVAYPGAGLLSCGAALKVGTGLVRSISDSNVTQLVVHHYPEVVVQAIDSPMESWLKSATAVLFGCGKGWNEKTAAELKQLLKASQVPLLIDADGLNCLSEHLDLLEQVHCPVILTPHVGEMKRLLAHMEEQDPVLGAHAFAQRYHTIVVLKGPHSFITDGKTVVRNPSGDRAMATAGMGDALAGMIAGLLAQGYAIFDACILGTYLHGLCGSIIAKTKYSVHASEVISLLPEVMHAIQHKKQL